jgi:hypothetical protein
MVVAVIGQPIEHAESVEYEVIDPAGDRIKVHT